MIDKYTLKQFENIDFDLVKQYLPSESVIIRDMFIGHESFVEWAEEQYEKNSVSCQS